MRCGRSAACIWAADPQPEIHGYSNGLPPQAESSKVWNSSERHCRLIEDREGSFGWVPCQESKFEIVAQPR